MEIGAHRAEHEGDGGEEHAIEHRHDDEQRRLERRCAQGDGGADAAEERERRREHELQIQLCLQRLPCGDGQRLQQPQALALEGDGGRRHVVHRGHHADSRAEQRRENAGRAGDDVPEQIDEFPPLPEQGDGGDGHEEDAQTAVEHIVRAGGEAAQLLAEQGAGQALRADGALAVFALRAGGAGGGGDAEEAAREDAPREEREHRHDRRDDEHGEPVALPHAPGEIDRVSAAAYLAAVDDGVRDQILNERLRLEIEEVIKPDEQERQQHDDEAPVLQPEAHLRHDPPEQTRQQQHEHRHEEDEQNAADDVRDRGARDDPPDDNGGHRDAGGIHEAHEIDAQQPREDERARRDRKAQKKIIVLREIEARIRVEHAAEDAEEDREERHDRKMQPAHARRREGRGEGEAERREHAAEHDDHEHDEEQRKADDPRLGAALIRLLIDEPAAEDLAQLLFNQQFYHLTPPPAQGRPIRATRRP